MHVVANQTFEQGMDKADGGAFKLVKGQAYPASKSEHGLVVNIAGRLRTIPPDMVKRLGTLALLEVVDG